MSTFRHFLQQEFIQRTERNKSYSLRAFARHLRINHATLSSLLSGKRPFTSVTIKKIALALEIGPDKVEEFTDSIKKDSSTGPFFLLQQDAFNAISDWYFDAILELTQIPKIALTPKLVSEAIGITEFQAKMALETLERLQLIFKDGNGRYKIQHINSTNILDNDFTTSANRKYQRSILEKSIAALSEVDRNERDHTSTTLAINRKDFKRAKDLIQKFRHDLNSFLQRDSRKFDEVYQLQVSFFPLSNLSNNGALNESR